MVPHWRVLGFSPSRASKLLEISHQIVTHNVAEESTPENIDTTCSRFKTLEHPDEERAMHAPQNRMALAIMLCKFTQKIHKPRIGLIYPANAKVLDSR